MNWYFDKDIQSAISILIDVGEELTKDVLPPFVSEKVENFLEFLFKIMTQLRVVSGMSISVIGFDYLSVIETAKIYKYKLNSKNMDFLRVAERLVVKKHNSKDGE